MMAGPTLREKMVAYSMQEGYDEFRQLLGDWMDLTTDEKVAYVSEHATFTNPDSLKVYIGIGRLEKQIWGIERARRGKTYSSSKYDVREHEVFYHGEAVLRQGLDMFVIPTDDGEKDVLLIIRIELV